MGRIMATGIAVLCVIACGTALADAFDTPGSVVQSEIQDQSFSTSYEWGIAVSSGSVTETWVTIRNGDSVRVTHSVQTSNSSLHGLNLEADGVDVESVTYDGGVGGAIIGRSHFRDDYNAMTRTMIGGGAENFSTDPVSGVVSTVTEMTATFVKIAGQTVVVTSHEGGTTSDGGTFSSSMVNSGIHNYSGHIVFDFTTVTNGSTGADGSEQTITYTIQNQYNSAGIMTGPPTLVSYSGTRTNMSSSGHPIVYTLTDYSITYTDGGTQGWVVSNISGNWHHEEENGQNVATGSVLMPGGTTGRTTGGNSLSAADVVAGLYARVGYTPSPAMSAFWEGEVNRLGATEVAGRWSTILGGDWQVANNPTLNNNLATYGNDPAGWQRTSDAAGIARGTAR